MDIIVTVPEIITNESGKYAAKNPWETHDFEYMPKYDKTIFFRTLAIRKYIKWYFTGEPPIKLDIDQQTGFIDGTIKVLEDQSKVVVWDWSPMEKMKVDGSNWRSVNRPKSPTYTFPFNIVLEYWKYDVTTSARAFHLHTSYIVNLLQDAINELKATSKDDPAYEKKYRKYIRTLNIYLQEYHIDKYEKKIEVLPTSIMVIKNNDIDAKKFFLAYLDAGYTDFPNPEKPGEYFRYEHALWKNGKRYTKENKEDYFK